MFWAAFHAAQLKTVQEELWQSPGCPLPMERDNRTNKSASLIFPPLGNEAELLYYLVPRAYFKRFLQVHAKSFK